MAGSFPINVAIDSHQDDYFENPEHLKLLAKLQDFLSTLPEWIKPSHFVIISNWSITLPISTRKNSMPCRKKGFEVRMLINSFKTMLGPDMLGRFMNENFSGTNMVLRTHISSSNDFLNTQKKIEPILKKTFPREFSFQVTGIGVVISHSSRLITDGQIKSLGMTLVLVFAIMFLLFMSFKVGIIGILPNCFPIIVSFGVMGWLGIPLSMATSLIAGVAIGLAVDDTIHYLVHYNQEFKKDLNKKRALETTIRIWENRLSLPRSPSVWVFGAALFKLQTHRMFSVF
jgi:predicted RND superfamily exporter protein